MQTQDLLVLRSLSSAILQVFPKEESHTVALRNATIAIVEAFKAGKERREDIVIRAQNYGRQLPGELTRAGR